MARTTHPAVVGTVEVWHDEDGWGVLRTPDGLSVFCHFSSVEIRGPVALVPGARVWFDYETPGQDGCDARVLTAARPDAERMDVPLGGLNSPADLPPGAYTSKLTTTFEPNA